MKTFFILFALIFASPQEFTAQDQDGNYVLGILNTAENTRNFNVEISSLGLNGKYRLFDVWSKKSYKKDQGFKI